VGEFLENAVAVLRPCWRVLSVLIGASVRLVLEKAKICYLRVKKCGLQIFL
jgi:hypothetical protein